METTISQSVIEALNTEVQDCYTSREYRPVAVAIIEDEAFRFLIIQSAKDPLTWSFPQGGINQGEDILSGLFREIQEEVGITSENFVLLNYCGQDQLDIPNRDGRGFSKGKRYFFFHIRRKGSTHIILQTDEVLDFKWVRRDDMEMVLATTRQEKRESLLKAFSRIPYT
jgi:putative (di)nucleoside polyphosphate hydrolase